MVVMRSASMNSMEGDGNNGDTNNNNKEFVKSVSQHSIGILDLFGSTRNGSDWGYVSWLNGGMQCLQ